MPEALRYKEINNTIYIQAEGHLTAAYCADLRELVFQRMDAPPTVEGILVDLSEVTYMDSTFLGLLVGFTKRLVKSGARLTIVTPSKAAQELLESLGIISLVTIIADPVPFPDGMQDIIKTQPSSTELLLRAHENLMELSSENRQKFETLHKILKDQADSGGSKQ